MFDHFKLMSWLQLSNYSIAHVILANLNKFLNNTMTQTYDVHTFKLVLEDKVFFGYISLYACDPLDGDFQLLFCNVSQETLGDNIL